MSPTPQVAFRIPPEIKQAALDRARREGTTLTARVTDWMVRYGRGENV
jgi:hypothetical protein